jgi:hypothetical protein
MGYSMDGRFRNCGLNRTGATSKDCLGTKLHSGGLGKLLGRVTCCFWSLKNMDRCDQYLGYGDPFHQGNSSVACPEDLGRVLGGGAVGGVFGEEGSLGL